MTQRLRQVISVNMASKSRILPMIITALVAGTAAFLLSQFQFSIWLESSRPNNDNPPIIEVNSPNSPQDSPNSPTPSSPSSSPRSTPTDPDALRVSNRTTYPVRVVLLTHQASTQTNPTTRSPSPYRDPVHWDFAPQEGSQGGLVLSLPEGDLKLNSADVLIAFALDGSRRYWGPYVVGNTPKPTRQTATSSWQLVLEP